MTSVLLVGVGVALLALPGLLAGVTHRPGARWARSSAAALVLGLAALEIGLILLALPAVLRVLSAAGLASWCSELVAPIAVGDGLGWVAALAATVVAARLLWASRRVQAAARTARIEPWLGHHEAHDDFDLVVLPTDELIAVSVPGREPQVLLSNGLVDALESDQLELVIRHEAMHHRFNHWRFNMLAVTLQQAFSPLPLVHRSAEALRTAIEVWADDATLAAAPTARARLSETISDVCGAARADSMRVALPRSTSMRLDRLAVAETSPSFPRRVAVEAPLVGLSTAFVVLFGSWSLLLVHVASSPH